jgi:hypothetical protein
LKELERYHRYTHLFQRVRMLRLLKTEECTNLGEAARALGYSWRQCHRWFASYKKGGLEELLKSRISERGRQELVSEEAFADLQEAMKRGEIATISEAEEFLRERHEPGASSFKAVSPKERGSVPHASDAGRVALFHQGEGVVAWRIPCVLVEDLDLYGTCVSGLINRFADATDLYGSVSHHAAA